MEGQSGTRRHGVAEGGEDDRLASNMNELISDVPL